MFQRNLPPSAWHHDSEDIDLYSYSHKNLKFNMMHSVIKIIPNHFN